MGVYSTVKETIKDAVSIAQQSDNIQLYKSILDAYNAAIELESKGIYEVEVIYFNRGMAYYKNKKYNQAIGDFTRAIEINPSSKYYYNRANAYEANGDDAAAMSDRIKAAAMIGE